MQFVEETKYKTEAEKFGDSLCFTKHLSSKTTNEIKKIVIQKWYNLKIKNWLKK